MPCTVELEVLTGVESGARFRLEAGGWIVGRGDGCGVQIRESGISRQHAELTVGTDGSVQLTDLGSHNGTLLEGEPVRAPATVRAFPAKLRIGTVDAVLRAAPERPADSATPPAPAVQMAPEVAAAAARIREFYPRMEKEFGRVIIGQRAVLEQLLIALAANGHCLMIGLPGLAKTLMVSTLARLLHLSFKRIQFTPDLMPADIIGSEILEVDETRGRKSFRFVKGPVFTNMLLADEINRTPPKTQAALLEAMQERQVTAANSLYPLPAPFFVLATQNPLEQEGTYPLPEAQLDRFLFNVLVDYPSEAEEEEVVRVTTARREVDLEPVLTGAELLLLQQAVLDLPVSAHVVKYATRLVRATRPKDPRAPEFIRANVACGAGPRAAQHLILAAKARAVIRGRANVSCDDVRHLAAPVMRHRIFTNFAADSEGVTPDILIAKLLQSIPEPGPDEYPAGGRA